MSSNRVIYKLENVSKVFKDKSGETVAVDNVNLDIYEGEIFGIIGMSGAGKSTLVRTLNRLEDISSGKIYFDGIDLSSLKGGALRDVRKQIAMIFQGFNLLMQKTVLDNVVIPLKLSGVPKTQRIEQGLEMLKIVGLAEKAKAYPGQLSGGQRQRVAIARALAMKPKVLLCDEATSALDPKITDEILELLKNINRDLNITIVIITHEMSVIERICDRVAIVDKGKLAEVGEVKDVFSSPKSDAAKKLVLPVLNGDNPFDKTDKRTFRIVFDGRSATEPIISNLVKETGLFVNILSANTRSVGGVGFGQMIVELPKDEESQKIILNYFESINMPLMEVFEEVSEQ